MRRSVIYWTAGGVAVVLAVLGVVIAASFTGKRGTDALEAGSTKQITDEPGTNNNADNAGDSREPGSFSEQELRELVDKYKDTPPPSGAPAKFLINEPESVLVRAAATPNAHTIGSVPNQATVWADCHQETGWDPIPDDQAGGDWLRIRWHTSDPGVEPGSSEQSGTFEGWVYRGLTLPYEHNGEIPTCTDGGQPSPGQITS